MFWALCSATMPACFRYGAAFPATVFPDFGSQPLVFIGQHRVEEHKLCSYDQHLRPPQNRTRRSPNASFTVFSSRASLYVRREGELITSNGFLFVLPGGNALQHSQCIGGGGRVKGSGSEPFLYLHTTPVRSIVLSSPVYVLNGISWTLFLTSTKSLIDAPDLTSGWRRPGARLHAALGSISVRASWDVIAGLLETGRST
mmetsp:Transcript_3031/g.14318  ORF Transcript_3031/g.14318 Transcript_3031/m.14318 type:complete len:200 (-) Transcript_3031:1550-2149(-)